VIYRSSLVWCSNGEQAAWAPVRAEAARLLGIGANIGLASALPLEIAGGGFLGLALWSH